MSLGFFTSLALTLVLFVTFALSPLAHAQESAVSKTCAQLGFKLGTKGHTDCVNQNSGTGGVKAAPKPASPAAKAPVVPELTAAQREDKFWDGVVASGNQEAFEAYLNQYPVGQYAGLAKANLSRIKAASAPPAVPQVIARAAGAVFKDCSDCPEMVVIPAGSFDMGGTGSDEQPVHRVTLRSFSMGKTEVAQGQWRAVMGGNPSRFSNCGDSCPVENVSWEDVKQFVSRLSAKTGKTYRLPSEAEWEYACRAGGREEYCGGGSVDSVAWHYGNSGQSTRPVAGKRPNAWGLHDMSGNVWEWTEDCWNGSYNGAPNDGSAWTAGNCSRRVVRGGSGLSSPRLLRAANRDGDSAADRYGIGGFRVARTD